MKTFLKPTTTTTKLTEPKTTLYHPDYNFVDGDRERERERERDRDRDRDRDRQTDRQTDRQRDRQRDRQSLPTFTATATRPAVSQHSTAFLISYLVLGIAFVLFMMRHAD